MTHREGVIPMYFNGINDYPFATVILTDTEISNARSYGVYVEYSNLKINNCLFQSNKLTIENIHTQILHR